MKRETLGGGDIKLIAAIGSFLGIIGTIFTMLLSSLAALLTIFLTGHDREKEFPYGPFLILGAVGYIFLSKSVFEFYLNFF
jgi:prepilin signal peptidase PulO-like enzyme (type II secretory pathway)